MKKTSNIFCRALNVPPSQTRSELANVIGLCEHLNDFLTTVEIEVCVCLYINDVFGDLSSGHALCLPRWPLFSISQC